MLVEAGINHKVAMVCQGSQLVEEFNDAGGVFFCGYKSTPDFKFNLINTFPNVIYYFFLSES